MRVCRAWPRRAVPRRRRGEALEAALLDAAWDELQTVGYAALRIEAVADRAGTTATRLSTAARHAKLSNMETQSSAPIPPGVARDQLRDARQAHDASVRRALAPAWLIVVLSVFCGVLTVPSVYRGPGDVATIIAVALVVAALIGMSARNQWRSLRSMPKPRWSVTEVMLCVVAVLVGGVVGPHLLSSPSNSALVSWGLGAAVAVIVAGCLFAASGFYRYRVSRTWRR